jgi:hypothetical protein
VFRLSCFQYRPGYSALDWFMHLGCLLGGPLARCRKRQQFGAASTL